MNLTLSQGRMDESIAKSLAISHTVVVATDTQARNQRMIHGLFVVPIVSGSVLLAVNFNRKAVDVDRRVCDAASSRGDDMILNAASQAVSHGFQIGRTNSEDADQTRLG